MFQSSITQRKRKTRTERANVVRQARQRYAEPQANTVGTSCGRDVTTDGGSFTVEQSSSVNDVRVACNHGGFGEMLGDDREHKARQHDETIHDGEVGSGKYIG